MDTVDRVSEILARLQQILPLPDDLASPQEYLTFTDPTELDRRIDAFVAILDELRSNLDPRMISPLVNSFGYGDTFGVNWSVLHLLEEFNYDALRPHLLAALQSERRGSRMWAAKMLKRQRDPSICQSLVALLKDPNEMVRSEAISAMQMCDSASLEPYLTDLQRDPSMEVQALLRTILATS